MSTDTIRLTRQQDGKWTATDEQTGATGQGQTREQALEQLDKADSDHNSVRIVMTPDMLHGQPRIEGTRIGVFMLGDSIREGGQSVADIVEGYPDLTREQVEAALAYYDAYPEMMDALQAEEDAIVHRVRNQSQIPARETDTDADT